MENPTINNTSATAGTFEVRCSNPTASNLSVVADLIFKKMEQEIWKEVKGFEGLYEVSNFSRIRSIERTCVHPKADQKVKERILKPSINSAGYLTCCLHRNGLRVSKSVHGMVAFAFLEQPAISTIRHVVDHINGNKLHNRPDNLRFVTNRYNGTFGEVSISANKSSKYPGVYWHKEAKKWQSQIYINGRRIYLGLFINEEDAHVAYKLKIPLI